MLLKDLTQAFGVSGYEREIGCVIKENIREYADEIIEDALGSIIALKKGCGEAKKRIMVSGHMDEIGFMTLKITDDGYVKVRNVGGISAFTSYMDRVRFRNGTYGIIGCEEKIDKIAPGDISKLYIDIGAVSKEDALKYVSIGEPACYVGEYQELKNNCVTAKALDDRIACYIMIEALKKMVNPYNDIYFVFSVQEEVGLRGATAAANRVNPDIGVGIDIGGSADLPNEKHGNAVLGGGAAIKVMDESVICDEYLVSEMVRCSEENKIKYQLDVMAGGGTDAGAINKSNYGVKSCGIDIPTRYGHSPNGIVSMGDVDACIDLLWKFADREFTF